MFVEDHFLQTPRQAHYSPWSWHICQAHHGHQNREANPVYDISEELFLSIPPFSLSPDVAEHYLSSVHLNCTLFLQMYLGHGAAHHQCDECWATCHRPAATLLFLGLIIRVLIVVCRRAWVTETCHGAAHHLCDDCSATFCRPALLHFSSSERIYPSLWPYQTLFLAPTLPSFAPSSMMHGGGQVLPVLSMQTFTWRMV